MDFNTKRQLIRVWANKALSLLRRNKRPNACLTWWRSKMSLSFSEARIFLSRDSNSFLKDQVRSTQDIENNKRRSKKLPTHEGRSKISVMRGWFNLNRWWELEVSMEPHHSKMIYYLKRRETSVKNFWSLSKEQIFHCLLIWSLTRSPPQMRILLSLWRSLQKWHHLR